MKVGGVLLVAAASTLGFQAVNAAPKPQTADLTSTLGPDITLTSSSDLPTTVPPSLTASEYSSPTATGDACARLASIAQAAPQTNPVVPAEVAWECLQAVPYDASSALAWVESLRPYIRWQSTLEYLKNPPEEYQLPAYDVGAAYDQIMSNVQKDNYANQYELESDIYNLFQQAHDGHFSYLPNLVTDIVSFGRPFALVDVSSNGEDLPKTYVYSDILKSYNDTGFEPSAVTEINGENSTSYLERLSLKGQLQDYDALWNNLFINLASVQLGVLGGGAGLFAGGGFGDLVYPNATTSVTFENGTTRTYQNLAQLIVPFRNITSAQDVYQRYVNPPQLPTQTGGVRIPRATPAPGFPNPIIRQAFNLVSGYYLEEDEYDDVAILGVPSFLGIDGSDTVAFEFLDQAKADGKTKLIIDLSANGGGSVLFGYELFVKLFPNIRPYLGTRFRATESFDIIGQTVSDWSNGTSELYFADKNGYRELSAFFGGFTPFPYASDLDENYEKFPDWPTKFGPHQYNGDNFTSIIQWNTSQPAIYINVNAITNQTTPLFEPENIILLTDGYCASTCSSFVEMMKTQAGVKNIVVGGKPSKNEMQIVGGTRGSNNYPWVNILTYVNLTYALVQATQPISAVVNLLNTELGDYLGSIGSDPLLPFLRAGVSASSINARDTIRADDEEQIPLQFKYEAADCRIFYTADMTVDITALWKEVTDVTWGDGECIVGRIQQNTRLTTRSTGKERLAKRRLQRRNIDAAELDVLADSVKIRTDHKAIDLSGGGIIVP